jgi:hypothetical protein
MWRWSSGGRVSSDGGDSEVMVVGRHSSDDSEVMMVVGWRESCWRGVEKKGVVVGRRVEIT